MTWEPEREDVVRLALEAGFMLSSAHRSDASPGVTPDHPVPVSDSYTLKRFAELVLAEAQDQALREGRDE